MNRHVNAISQRLSLRTPQRDSLEILDCITEIIPLDKERDLEQALKVIASEFPTVEDFERDFPSLCFALATGVGKTRLMGAFISYLHIAHGIEHFFVLAPNLTIYNKLIADFTPNTPKYVFRGIAEFAMTPPEIITGENYEGKGQLLDQAHGVHINIFNISKINSEVRGGKAPKIKRLSEYIGESYFDYLSKLDDLVLLMDESHRYRASAGVKALNELNPVIGLELTATPQVESGSKSTPFQNVIYSYPLYRAMEDGYVKEPAVATRENFNAKNYTEEQLERLKLEDGIRVHETVKTELKVYADNHDQPYVKPFMLVVAQDTTHAEELMAFMKSDEFFEGRYKDRVITVHSAQRGEEKDETVERLLSVEDPNEPTEIVVHVNMLKEGWDVTNLYTIVPLRAANSRTLVEQSIGRGLRLPFGKRTGVPAVDRLTIVAHDRFDDIIREANDQKSIIRTGIVIGRDVPDKPKKSVEVRSFIETAVSEQSSPLPKDFSTPFETPKQKAEMVFKEEEKAVAQFAYEAIKDFEKLPSSKKLKEADTQKALIEKVEDMLKPAQGELVGVVEKPNVEDIVRRVTDSFIDNIIDIPKIVITPKNAQNYTFGDFDLDTTDIGRLQPVDQNILIQHLRTAEREQLTSEGVPVREDRMENYIVSALIDYDDISYDDHADLLYKLAGQMVEYVRGYLNDENDVLNVLQFHRKDLARLIHAQMQKHFRKGYTEFTTTVTRGFERPKMASLIYDGDQDIRFFRDEIKDKSQIRSMVFGGYQKCLYPLQKFDSDSERIFSALLEDDASVMKWYKPTRDDFKIFYSHTQQYHPDFIVETKDRKLICEPKKAIDVDTAEVQEKAEAARQWCEAASKHALENDGKPWEYLLIPHDAIRPSATLDGLISQFKK